LTLREVEPAQVLMRLQKKLVQEGYSEVHLQLGGITIRKQLREACRASKLAGE
jgi:hypothetical protein